MTSLRGRLLSSTLILFGVAWLVVAYRVERAEQHQVMEQFDVLLQQKHQLLQVIVRHEAAEADVAGFAADLASAELAVNFRGYSYGLEYQVGLPDGKRVLSSSGVAGISLLGGGEGFSHRLIDGNQWRVLERLDAKSNHRIAVGYRVDDREELMDDIVEETLHPLSITMLALSLMLWYVIGSGLYPLKKLAREIQDRHPLALHTVDVNAVPREVEPLVVSLNSLFQRLSDAFENYDSFTMDAAHELRTPLAGLALQVEASLRATTDDDRRHALTMVRRGVLRATHIVEQMLALARLSTVKESVASETVDLYEVCRAVVENLADEARERRIEIELSREGETTVPGNSSLIEVLATNLVRNAILYSPSGERVRVRVGIGETGPCIRVEDKGPGIPADKREVVLQRFKRLTEGDSEGSGLGLAIARRIAELHGSTLELIDGPEGVGLCVQVCFPPH